MSYIAVDRSKSEADTEEGRGAPLRRARACQRPGYSGSVEQVHSGTVYLALDSGIVDLADEVEDPHWWSRIEFNELGRTAEEGPDFADASVGVEWWKSRGAERIFVTLDDYGPYLWAGTGPPPNDPETGQPLEVPSKDDPRGRPEGAWATAVALPEAHKEDLRNLFADRERNPGERLQRRREAVGLSVEELALRTHVDPTWVEAVETGEKRRRE